jgi:hypothetical protein
MKIYNNIVDQISRLHQLPNIRYNLMDNGKNYTCVNKLIPKVMLKILLLCIRRKFYIQVIIREINFKMN